MKKIPVRKVTIQDEFWGSRLAMNASKAIDHQWKQLEKTGCIQNFLLVADGIEGIREGLFFADSDAYKWLDAAARVYATHPSSELKARMDALIDLIHRTQTSDGYIYTYNQYFTPNVRWSNLQIEHELYCHGHLIEAGVSHYEATGDRTLLDIVIKSADLLVRDFLKAGPTGTPGHQEIELALIRLYHVTQENSYLDLAEHFLEQRGRIRPFISHILAQNRSVGKRRKRVEEDHQVYITAHPEHRQRFQLPDDNVNLQPPGGKLRWFLNTASGKYFQQHKPIRKQNIPVGHAVRFAYQETATAMLYRERGDPSLLITMENAWDHMVTRRMYVTGGTGALPNIEGFGRDYELDPVYSYSETCAALGDILWNWEMTQITKNAKYADLTEWMLYNAAAVGLGQDGTSYLYNNPLTCHGEVTRQSWFKCPCCPSNISRVWADLSRYLYSQNSDSVWVHQYVGNQVKMNTGSGEKGLGLKVDSKLPWEGYAKVELLLETPKTFTLHLRVPSWCDSICTRINGAPFETSKPDIPAHHQTASGYDPYLSYYLPIQRSWHSGDVIEVEFEMGIQIRASHPKVRATQGQVALTRGPLVYCLESIDNPDIDIFNCKVDPASLHPRHRDDLYDGVTVLTGSTPDGSALAFIPYFLWANRGESQMTVYTRTS